MLGTTYRVCTSRACGHTSGWLRSTARELAAHAGMQADGKATAVRLTTNSCNSNIIASRYMQGQSSISTAAYPEHSYMLLSDCLGDSKCAWGSRSDLAASTVNRSRWGSACMRVEMLVTSCMARGSGLGLVGVCASTACCSAPNTT